MSPLLVTKCYVNVSVNDIAEDLETRHCAILLSEITHFFAEGDETRITLACGDWFTVTMPFLDVLERVRSWHHIQGAVKLQ